MVDWAFVLSNSAWLVGLAMLLACISLADYARSNRRLGLKGAWHLVTSNGWVRLGGLLFCVGMGLSSDAWWQKGLWALLCLNIIYEWWRAAKRGMRNAECGMVALLPHHPPRQTSAFGSPRLAGWLVRPELLWLALLSPFFIFPTPAGTWALFGLPLLWVARWIAHGRFLPSTPLDWPLALMSIMMLVSLFATFDITLSLGKITLLLFGIGLYYAVVEWASRRERLAQAAGAYMLAGAGLGIVGLLGTDWVGKFPALAQVTGQLPPLLQRLAGEESGFNANIIGGALLFIVPLQLAVTGWLWTSSPGVKRLLWLRMGALLCVALAVGTLLLTQSRNALISLAIGVVFLLWLTVRRAKLLLALGAIVALVVVIYLGPGQVAADLSSNLGLRPGDPSDPGAAASRLEIWSRALYGIEDFAFTGMGMGTFSHVMPVLYPAPSFAPERDIGHAHNQFLQAGLDLGLPGLVAFMSIWIVAVALAWCAWRRSMDSWGRALSGGIMASLLCTFLFGLTDSVVMVAKPGFIFWALLALLVALYDFES
ncbi:MAG TPA: O-antigen ligase family protein [Chloroflexia bacterium]|nr:O-antigen ligase family protein [Chloroflexia bacterium]